MQTILKIFIFLTIGVIGVFLSPLITDPLSNNRKLRKLEHAFQDIQHPEGTVILSTRSDIGILSGNGNHCDFFVGSIINVPEGINIKDSYENQQIPVPFEDSSVSLDIESCMSPTLSDLRRFEVPTSIYHLSTFSQWGIEKPSNLEHVYVISVFLNQRHNADFRCH
jgi:hypothetical protein